jgi:leucyl aminopeptidase
MSSDAGLAADVVHAAELAGDRVAQIPLFPEYDVCLKSDVADLKNHAGKEAGSISAAVFLRSFTGDLPWAHLDIAGSAWNAQGSQTQIPKGPSGTPVRTLVHLAQIFASRR